MWKFAILTSSSFSTKKNQWKNMTKIMLVGEAASGKTALIGAFKEGQPLIGYNTDPTILFEKCSAYIEYEGSTLELELYDTAGDHLFRKSLTSLYPDIDVVVICYSIGNPDDLSNVTYEYASAVMFHVYMFLSLPTFRFR